MRYLTSFGVAMCIVSGAQSAHAVVVFEDNFDSYTDQASFDAVWSVLAGTSAGVTYENVQLSTDQSVSPTKSAKAPAQPTGATLLQRSYHDFPAQTLAAAGDKIVLSFDFYDSNSPSAAYREYAEIRSTGFASSTNQLIAVGLNNNQLESASGGPAYMGRILGYTPLATDADGGANEDGTLAAGQFFKLNDFGTGTRALGWHNLKVEITSDDLASTDYNFYVDNQLAEKVSNVGSAASLRSYERVVLGSALTNNNTAAYFDNVKVEFIAAGSQTGVPGDYNGNNVVDAADYVLWRNGGPLQNEVDNVGTVDANDYAAWRARFSNTAGSGSGLQSAAVPEPAGAVLLVLGAAVAACANRRRG